LFKKEGLHIVTTFYLHIFTGIFYYEMYAKIVQLYSFVTVFTLSCKLMFEATVNNKKTFTTTRRHFASEFSWLYSYSCYTAVRTTQEVSVNCSLNSTKRKLETAE